MENENSNSYIPNQIQIRLIDVIDRNTVKVQIYERNQNNRKAFHLCSKEMLTTVYQLGLVDNKVSVQTPDGKLQVEVAQDGRVRIMGEDRDNTSVTVTKGFMNGISRL